MQWLSIRQLALHAFIGLMLALLTRGSLQAALVAYDGFDYTTGQELSGQNGGVGFSGGWSTYVGSASIQAGSLNGAGLTTAGGKVFFDPTTENLNIFRTLQSPLTPASGVTYISFLADLQSGQRFLGMSLYDGASEVRLIGKGGGASILNWGIYGSGGSSAGTVPATTESLLVLRIDWTAGATAEALRLWAYPSSGSLPLTEPAIGTANATLSVQIAQITQLRIGAGFTSGDIEANGWIDELRVGTTWNDVVPVPEPSSLILLSLGAMCGVGVLKQRRNK